MKLPDRLRKPGYRYLAALAMTGIMLTSPQWTRAALRRLTYFHVRRIEIRGVRYLQPEDVVARLHVDTLRSVVDDVTPLETRLRAHPQVRDAHITRRFPGTLIVEVTENLPVALVPRGDGLQPYDSAGRALPIDPSRVVLDLPVVTAPDPRALALMGTLRATNARVFARISEVEPVGGDLLLTLTPALRIRVNAGVAAERFQDIFPVESDLTRRNERPSELDIRYRDQVVARLQ